MSEEAQESTVYRVRVEGPGLSVDREVPEAIGQQVVMLVVTGRPDLTRAGAPSGAPVAVSAVASRSPLADMSLAEFLEQARPKRNPDKIAAIATYLRRFRAQETFTPADIVAGFEEAAQVVPANLSRDLKWAIRNAWIARSATKGAYYVTRAGMQAVDAQFPREVLSRTQVPAPRRRGAARNEEETS